MARDIHAQSVPLPKFPMSAFDLGYSLKTCTAAGIMSCNYVEECIPGDIAHIRSDIFMRLDPLTFPIMHKIKIRQNFFFVPTRLILGDDLQKDFFSYKDMSARLPQYLIPNELSIGAIGPNTLFDQMECQPVTVAGNYLIRNPLPFLMYHKIWSDYYADEILDSSDISAFEDTLDQYRAVGLNGVINAASSADLFPFFYRKVSYSKDRFTSAQPDAQRVGEVYLMNPLSLERTDGGDIPGGNTITLKVLPDGTVATNSSPSYNLRQSLTIDELWDEMAVQRFLNSMNEFGNERYVEILAGQYGVISADARLQRAQWLGGSETVVNVSEVLQTSETTDNSPLGALGGRGIVSGRGRDIAFKVPEHGFIIGILSVVPENGYASGSPRWLYKSTPMDFALPRFNNLGEQAVYNGELFSDHRASGSLDLDEFGYQPQYDEYRSHVSRATGEFRSNQFLSWHLDRKFTSIPPLNSNFIHVDVSDTNRIFNDQSDTSPYHYRVHTFHKAMYVRPISKHPIPGKL